MSDRTGLARDTLRDLGRARKKIERYEAGMRGYIRELVPLAREDGATMHQIAEDLQMHPTTLYHLMRQPAISE